MTKVSASELSSVASSSALKNLNTLSRNYKSAARAFDNFANYSTLKLQGKGYDAVRRVASSIGTAFSKSVTLYSKSYESILEGTNNFIAFMEDYETLNNAELSKLEATLETFRSNRDYFWSKIGDEDMPNAGWYYQCYNDLYEDLNKECKKLRALDGANKSSGSYLDFVSGNVDKFNSLINDMKV